MNNLENLIPKYRGIKDLCSKHRYSAKHLQEKMIKENIPGNWDSIANIYNLINGRTSPKDPFIYIFLSEMLEERIEEIIYRYSSAERREVKSNDLW